VPSLRLGKTFPLTATNLNQLAVALVDLKKRRIVKAVSPLIGLRDFHAICVIFTHKQSPDGFGNSRKTRLGALGGEWGPANPMPKRSSENLVASI